jgi:hypothetical protein
MALFTALTWTQLLMTNPPKSAQRVPNWILGTLLVSAVIYALDRKRVAST